MLFSYFNITVVSEWLAFIASVFLLKKDKEWQYFTFLLLITIVGEFFGWYLHFILNKSNNWIFNILLFISTPFFLWVLSQAQIMYSLVKILYASIIVYLIGALINFFFFEGVLIYNKYTEVFGDILCVVMSCLFFLSILKEEESRDIFKYEYFWFANGLLFYCLGNTVLYLFLDPLRAFSKQKDIPFYIYINGGLNVIFYGSLIISFIWRSRTIKLLQE